MALLTTVSLGVAQVFAMSTRVNYVARGQTSATTMAEQKLEQLRGLTWGFDLQGQGLPQTDTTTNLPCAPPDTHRQRIEPVAVRCARAEHRRVRRFSGSATAPGSGTGATPPGNADLYPPLVDSAAADESEQHAGASRCWSRRSPAKRTRVATAFTRTRMAARRVARDVSGRGRRHESARARALSSRGRATRSSRCWSRPRSCSPSRARSSR